jgi:hypothetical protein
MKAKVHYSSLLIASVIAFCIRVTAEETNLPAPIPGYLRSDHWNWGTWTNGVCGEAMVIWDPDHNMLPGVQVSIVNSNAPLAMNSNVDTLTATELVFGNSSLYFAPTNLFCGPVELKNTEGRTIPTTRPDLALAAAYPRCISLRLAEYQKPPISGGKILPGQLLSWHAQLARFPVNDLFRLEENGVYTLTVWPRIYQRAATNTDECCRLDLPPVSVRFEWRGGGRKGAE